jgi:uncharacterized protein YfbU (UPF0304 family)
MDGSSAELSPVQRLMLANQFRILAKVDPEYAHEYSLDEKIEILEQGFEGEYGKILNRFEENRLSDEDCELVHDVLVMTSTFLDLKGETTIDLGDFEQAGFDNNQEYHHLAYARFLLERNPGGFPGIEDAVDVHHPTLDRYRKMFAEWKKSKHPASLTEADVARIMTK